MQKRIVAALLMGAVISGTTWGQAPAVKIVANSDTQWAHELLQLNQPSLIAAQEAASKGTPAENLWKAQTIAATWDEIAKQGETVRMATEYVAAMNAYLEQNPDVDGVWALDHAKFIYGQLSQRVVTRMENWVNTPKDRAALAPMAELGDALLKKSTASLDSAVRYYESRPQFDENAYTRVATAQAEGHYYNVWGQYFKAMSMEPGTKARKDLLLAGAGSLAQWADEATDNGVNHQALLLRGKMQSEAGNLVLAKKDLDKAMLPVATDEGGKRAAPEWVVYQARYQKIVTQIRERDFASALSAFEEFKKTLPQDNKLAMMSAEMLRYRIVWAEAETKEGAEKKETQLKAMGILAEIIKAEPGFRDLIYEQLGSQIADNTDVADLLPMQQLAIAYAKSQGQRGETEASKQALREAVKASVAVKENKSSTASDKLEATYLAGICSAVLNDLVPAIQFNVEFVELSSAKDERAKKVLDITMGQIGQLKKEHPDVANSAQVRTLVEKALLLSVTKFGDDKYAFYLAVSLVQAEKLDEAARAFARVPQNDPKYVEAQYGLVSIATTRFSELTGKQAPQADVQRAANDLFKTCGNFVALLERPPAGIPAETLNRFRSYRTDILFIEATTALNPNVNDGRKALDRIEKLYKLQGELTPRMQGAVLRLKIQAMQTSNANSAEIMKVMHEYAKALGKDPVDVMTAMASQTLEEATRIEKTDPAQAKSLANFVVKLFDPIIEEKNKSGTAADKKAAFDLRSIKAHMMVLAGDYMGAQALCLQLQKEDPVQLSPFQTEARAMFLKAKETHDNSEYAKSLDLFKRILPRLTPGNEGYWESWLRIIQCMEAIKGDVARDEIKQKLRDLRSSSPDLGGSLYKQDYDRLVVKYGA